MNLKLMEEDGIYSCQNVAVQRLEGKSLLLTGASGIIGSHFLFGLYHCQRDLGLEIDVSAVVRRGIPEHLKPIESQGYARFLLGDLCEDNFSRALPQVDIVVHAATYGQPKLFLANAVSTLKLNTATTLVLLDKLLPGGMFLFISSSEVYSGSTHTPFSEDDIGTTNPAHPRSCYIEAKRCGEAIINAYRAKGIDSKSVRLSLAYGTGTRGEDKRVLYSFVERALKEKYIKLMDSGSARRTYCYVADAVYMMWRVLLEGKQPVYNVGGISATTILALAQLIGSILDVPVKAGIDADIILGAPAEVVLDLSRFTNEFGPVSFMNFPMGMSRTIEWQRALYSV